MKFDKQRRHPTLISFSYQKDLKYKRRLGKTVQILTFFLLNPMPEPVLVVMPASIIPNWMAGIQKFLNLPEGEVLDVIIRNHVRKHKEMRRRRYLTTGQHCPLL
jgi:SNF2 family DNA or RNA helicase